MKDKKKYFMLFSCCKIVKGASRSLICDLQRSKIRFISNELYAILEGTRENPIEVLNKKFMQNGDNSLYLVFDTLVNEELGYYTSSPEIFPPIDTHFDHPSVLSNAIIDVSNISNHDFYSINNQLSELGCETVEIRFFELIELDTIESILDEFMFSSIRSIYLLICYDELFNDFDILDRIFKKNDRILGITVHSVQIGNSLFDLVDQNNYLSITSDRIDSNRHCGQISPDYFTLNIPFYNESIMYNNCLNRKVGIDENGNIKNCPSSPITFGNIKHIKIKDVVISSEFQKLWNISKSQITTCNVCEFRLICSDCRIYTEGDDIFAKPLKCSYDPFNMKWHD
jgi:SPASM domain peptide maturase of grasp-with-spasm system